MGICNRVELGLDYYILMVMLGLGYYMLICITWSFATRSQCNQSQCGHFR